MKDSVRSNSKILGFALLAGLLSAIGGTVYDMGAWRSRAVRVETEVAATQFVYVCMSCRALSMKAGTCVICQKELNQRHFLGAKDGQALLCNCSAECSFAAEGIGDGKCERGKGVVTISAKGMYVCPKGCQFISETAGKCVCGMQPNRVGTAVEQLATANEEVLRASWNR